MKNIIENYIIPNFWKIVTIELVIIATLLTLLAITNVYLYHILYQCISL